MKQEFLLHYNRRQVVLKPGRKAWKSSRKDKSLNAADEKVCCVRANEKDEEAERKRKNFSILSCPSFPSFLQFWQQTSPTKNKERKKSFRDDLKPLHQLAQMMTLWWESRRQHCWVYDSKESASYDHLQSKLNSNNLCKNCQLSQPARLPSWIDDMSRLSSFRRWTWYWWDTWRKMEVVIDKMAENHFSTSPQRANM